MPAAEHRSRRSLAEWLEALEQAHGREIDLGLARLGRVWEALGSPRCARRIVTVAGTNGKGSVVHALEALARAEGLRTGTTTSPHLVRFNERIRIDGTEATDAAIVAAFERIEAARLALPEGPVSLTYFEAAILAALLLMAAADLDLAILEVGLGGRLDAVNLVDCDLAVVTPVDLDHQAWLGDDRETIGAEKAGVLRPRRPVVLTDPEPPASVLGRATALSAPVL
ncbi:MAG: Mur ligase family protein, partial [Pseudomonadales bacterium]|nr:Mur ligase family protein [Pseudomonadales bacterium]